MSKITSRFVATAVSVVALLSVCSIASAQPRHGREVHRLEVKLARLQAKKDTEMARHHPRAARRTQIEIDGVQAQLRAIRH